MDLYKIQQDKDSTLPVLKSVHKFIVKKEQSVLILTQ
jgi:hypothetical protein